MVTQKVVEAQLHYCLIINQTIEAQLLVLTCFYLHLVARRFESEYGVVRISLGDAMRTVLTNQPKTDLACKLQAILKSGQTVPDDLAIAALQVALMDMNCATRG